MDSKTVFIVVAVVAIVIAIGITATIAIAMSSRGANVVRGYVDNVVNYTKGLPHHRCARGFKHIFGGMAPVTIEVSEGFKQRVEEILKMDPNTSTLLKEGYNITTIRPIVKIVVQEDGDIVMRATRATVEMVKLGVGRAVAYVDLESRSVLRLVICRVMMESSTADSTEGLTISTVV